MQHANSWLRLVESPDRDFNILPPLGRKKKNHVDSLLKVRDGECRLGFVRDNCNGVILQKVILIVCFSISVASSY